QMAAVGLHGLAADALDLHQLVVDAVDEAVVLVEHVGEAAGHARAEVHAGLAQYADEAAGHVFAAVVTGAFHHGVGTGVAHGEALAGGTGGEQAATGGAVQAGVANDGRLLSLQRAAGRRHDDQLAAGHAFADVVVGVAFQAQVQATGVPHAEALAGGALEAEGDRRVLHALVAVLLGDLAGNPRADGAVAVADVQLELAAGLAGDGLAGHLDHLLGQLALVERRVAVDLAE